MATLKLLVVAARDLPVMDRQSHSTDAYVEVRHGDQNRRTQTKRKTLNPTWRHEFAFDIADYSELQEQPLEVKVWDHDTWTADDLIGNVFLDLNMLLCTEGQPHLAAWFPIFDSMRGLRGELYLSLQIKFMHGGKHANPFIPYIPECKDGQVVEKDIKMTHPSIAAETESVLIFATSRLDPNLFRVVKVVGMVEELSIRHDPEHARLQSLRSSRITNEQRMLQFFKASGHVRRMLARKAIEHGCNCIIGYKECYDLEPSVGNIIIRAAGTCCQVAKVVRDPQSKKGPDSLAGGSIEDEDQPSPSWPYTSRSKRHMRNLNQLMKEATRLLTMKSLPCNVIKRIGGVVSARSIKLITQLKSKAVVQERDSWWQEIREEVKINARAFCCNAVIGYTETTSFIEDVVILSGTGTAVVADWGAFNWSTTRQLLRQYHKESRSTRMKRGARDPTRRSDTRGEACQLLHIPVTDSSKLMTREQDDISKCLWCKNKPVPAFLLANMEIPAELPIDGVPQLIETRYVKKKADSSGEALAAEISKMLPHLEYHVHRQLVHKVQNLGLNAAFGIKVDITLGSAYAIATATATGVYIPCLPTVRNASSEEQVKVAVRSSVLKLNYFPKSPRPTDPADAASPGPKQSDTDTDTSSSSSSTSGSSGSSDSSGDDGDTMAEIFSAGSDSGHIKPYVIELDKDEEELMAGGGVGAGDVLLMNVDNIGASTVNLKAAHSISLQRRFEFDLHHTEDPNIRLRKVFNHLHSILRCKLRGVADGVLASYRSEVIFASDNDINIRLFGFLLLPQDNRAWFGKSLDQILVEVEAQRSARRERKLCGRVHGLRFVLAGCKDSAQEKANSIALEIRYGQNDNDVLKLESKQATVNQPILFKLPQAVTVIEYRIKCTDGEPGKDPAEWSLCGSIKSNPSKGKSFPLSQVAGFEMPIERGQWSDPIPCERPVRRSRVGSALWRKTGSSPGAPPEDIKKRARSMKGLLRDKGSPPQGHLNPQSPRATRSPRKRILGPSKDEAAHGDTTSAFSRQPTSDSIGANDTKPFHLDPEPGSSAALLARAHKKYKPFRWEVPYLQATSPFSLSALGPIYSPDGSEVGGTFSRDFSLGVERCESTQTATGVHGAHDYLDRPDSHHIIISPMDSVPGCTIRRYLGFLSHHFLRESEKVQVQGTASYSNGLGNFYHCQVLESNHILRRLVHSMDGNALLSCSITQHAMLDSDASRNAYHFYTVTGQIAEVLQDMHDDDPQGL